MCVRAAPPRVPRLIRKYERAWRVVGRYRDEASPRAADDTASLNWERFRRRRFCCHSGRCPAENFLSARSAELLAPESFSFSMPLTACMEVDRGRNERVFCYFTGSQNTRLLYSQLPSQSRQWRRCRRQQIIAVAASITLTSLSMIARGELANTVFQIRALSHENSAYVREHDERSRLRYAARAGDVVSLPLKWNFSRHGHRWRRDRLRGLVFPFLRPRDTSAWYEPVCYYCGSPL